MEGWMSGWVDGCVKIGGTLKSASFKSPEQVAPLESLSHIAMMLACNQKVEQKAVERQAHQPRPRCTERAHKDPPLFGRTADKRAGFHPSPCFFTGPPLWVFLWLPFSTNPFWGTVKKDTAKR